MIDRVASEGVLSVAPICPSPLVGKVSARRRQHGACVYSSSGCENVAAPPQRTRKRDPTPLALQYNGVSGCSTVDCKGIPYIHSGGAVGFSPQ